jgi:hypothetical protein
MNLNLPIKSPLHFLNIEYIQGPISLTEWKGFGKHIYVFGDVHKYKKGCNQLQKNIRIDEYISQVINYNRDKLIDIYLEIPYIQKNEIRKYSSLIDEGYLFNQTNKRFLDCLEVKKNNCKYKNTRFHYIDIRFAKLRFYINMQFLYNNVESLAIKFDEICEKIEDETLTKKKLNKSIDEIFNILYRLYKKDLFFDYNEAVNLAKINKQIKNIKDDNVRLLLDKKLNKLRIEFNEVQNIIDFINKTFFDFNNEKFLLKLKEDENIHFELQNKFSEFNGFLLNFEIHLMDLYLLGRIFRSFKGGSDPKFIIIYTGGTHSDNYNKFFGEIGMKSISHSYSEDQCVNISKFKRPFFR